MKHDPFDLRRDSEHEAEAKRQAAMSAKLAAEDLRSVMDTPSGRRVMWRLLEQTSVYRSTFNTNALAMAYAEGGRQVGLAVLQSIIDATPHRFFDMQTENLTHD